MSRNSEMKVYSSLVAMFPIAVFMRPAVGICDIGFASLF